MEPTLNDYNLSCELLGHSMDVRAVCGGPMTPDSAGQVIISGSRDKTTKVWKPSGNEYTEAVTYQDHKNFVSCIYYLQSEQWICTGSNDATICIYKVDGYVPIITLKGHESTVCAIAEGHEAQSIISGSWDKTARLWTIDQLGGVSSIELRGHEAAVWAVASMPGQKKYITGGADKCIYYWNAKGEQLRMLKGHTDCVRGLVALSDNTVVSAANDATIRYWNEDGECVQQLSGHTNYIYGLSQNKSLGEHIMVTCGEDSTLRMWNVATGKELGEPIVHPAISVWTVTCLANGDIVSGCSDGIVRVFTKDPTRVANEATLKAFLLAVSARAAQIDEEIGGVKKTDLPGPEALLSNGTREGQSKMIRHPDGAVKCYIWELGKWNLVGDVTGASGGTQASSGKKLYEGKEYDYVFDVDVSDTDPPIKLPYNRGEDVWQAAQSFIHRHNLPQAYLDQIANFIIKNSGNTATITQSATIGYQDPFTGGARYVPGSSNTNFQSGGNVDPFTGGSSYSTTASAQQKVDVNFVKGSDKHFPVSKYLSVDNCDAIKILDKLKEFNNRSNKDSLKLDNNSLDSVIKLTDLKPQADTAALEALNQLLHWPSEILFPVIDVLRLAVRTEPIFVILQNSYNFLGTVLPKLSSSAPNQLMIIRCLVNMMLHESGRLEIQKRLQESIEHISSIKTGNANLQIAIATFYLNLTITQTVGAANADVCHTVTTGIIELLKWAVDLEACYRSMLAIGNLTTTPYGADTIALVVSVDFVMDRIRELTNTPQGGNFAKINSAGQELLAAL